MLRLSTVGRWLQIVSFLSLSPLSGVMAESVSLTPLSPAEPAVRRPVDLCLHGDHLFTANSGSGSVSMLDPSLGKILAEFAVGKEPVAIKSAGSSLLLVDSGTHQLLSLTCDSAANSLAIRQTHDVPHTPVDLAVSADGTLAAVTSLWARCVTLFRIDDGGELRELHRVPLSFAPRRALFVGDRQLVVADSFGGQLIVVATETGAAGRPFRINGHNIRGLALTQDGKSLLVTAQMLNPDSFTTYERVFWGVLMRNNLHTIPLNALQTGGMSSLGKAGGYAESVNDSRDEDTSYDTAGTEAQYGLYPLGTPSIGSGDPGRLIITEQDVTLLAVSGTNQVAFRMASHLPFERLKVGHRPEALCVDPARNTAFVANRFDDSITMIRIGEEGPEVTDTISLGTGRELSLVERGEQLFYDASLSLDGWYSCHSCHTDGHTNGLLSDTFGDEDLGAPKKVLSLLGTADTGPWAWNGGRGQLEEQVTTSLIISMQCQLETDELPVVELSAYLRTLRTPPSVSEAREEKADPQLLDAGKGLFSRHGCSDCHAGRTLTSTDVWDTGLHDELGATHFNPPSLLGVSQRSPWFHDGRAATLEDVLRSSHHDQSSPLPEQDIPLLRTYLESL